ncbi:hypothetical protein SAMN02910453_1948 [Lachnospiraceae bacterium A10]|nr:hypothetical protein SAMN02910453_1948 [Lachnospiraceae bacterium A10]
MIKGLNKKKLAALGVVVGVVAVGVGTAVALLGSDGDEVATDSQVVLEDEALTFAPLSGDEAVVISRELDGSEEVHEVTILENTSVYASSSLKSAVIGYLESGSEVDSYGTDGDFDKVSYYGRLGYVAKRVVDDPEASEEEDTSESEDGTENGRSGAGNAGASSSSSASAAGSSNSGSDAASSSGANSGGASNGAGDAGASSSSSNDAGSSSASGNGAGDTGASHESVTGTGASTDNATPSLEDEDPDMGNTMGME